jgi:hypothetical protein
MFVEIILYNCYKYLRDKYYFFKNLSAKDKFTLLHTSFYIFTLTYPVYYRYHNLLYVYFSLIYAQWIILGRCILSDNKKSDQPCDFVKTFYVLGIFKSPMYKAELSYISDIIAVPSYIYCGFQAGYGLKTYIFPIIFVTKSNKKIHHYLWKVIDFS